MWAVLIVWAVATFVGLSVTYRIGYCSGRARANDYWTEGIKDYCESIKHDITKLQIIMDMAQHMLRAINEERNETD